MASLIQAPKLEGIGGGLQNTMKSDAPMQLKATAENNMSKTPKLSASGAKGGMGLGAWGSAIGDSISALASINSNDAQRRNALKNDAMKASQNLQRANLNAERINLSAVVTPEMSIANEEDKLNKKPFAGIPQQVTNRPANMATRPQPTSVARKGLKLIKRP